MDFQLHEQHPFSLISESPVKQVDDGHYAELFKRERKAIFLHAPEVTHNKKPAVKHSDLWEYLVQNPEHAYYSCRKLSELTGYSKTTCHRVQVKAWEVMGEPKHRIKKQAPEMESPAPSLNIKKFKFKSVPNEL